MCNQVSRARELNDRLNSTREMFNNPLFSFFFLFFFFGSTRDVLACLNEAEQYPPLFKRSFVKRRGKKFPDVLLLVDLSKRKMRLDSSSLPIRGRSIDEEED